MALINTFNPEKQSTKFDDILLVADTSLQAIRCIPNVACLWKSPRETFSIYKLRIFDNDEGQDDFFPFSVRSGLPNDNQFIVTNPVKAKIYLTELSPGYKEAAVLHVITQQGIYRPLDCMYCNGKYFCTDKDGLNAITLQPDGKIELVCLNPGKRIVHGFSIVAAQKPLDNKKTRLLVSDYKSHSIIEIDEDDLTSNVIAGQYNTSGFEDGPLEIARLNCPVGLACRGTSVYVAEHPDDHQGSVRIVQYLEGLKRFQVIWNLVSKAFGMVSRKETWIDPNQAEEKKKISITDAKENLQTAANNLSELIGKISTLHGNMQLDITTGSMIGTTAAAVYETLLDGLVFIIDYFNYIEKPELLDNIVMSQLCDKLIEDFFGKLTERTQGKNLRIGDMARRITNCAFTYMLGHIVTKDQDAVGVSFSALALELQRPTCTHSTRSKTIRAFFGCFLTSDMRSFSQ